MAVREYMEQLWPDILETFASSFGLGCTSQLGELEAIPVLVEARVAWGAFRRIRRLVNTKGKKKMLRRARKFQLYVSHLRRVKMIPSSWKHIFAEANSL